MFANELKTEAGTSSRDIELNQLNEQLKPLGLRVFEVLSDGNCLYRAIAHQITDQLTRRSRLSRNGSSSDSEILDYIALRRAAADHIKSFSETYAPFLGVECSDPALTDYCRWFPVFYVITSYLNMI